MPISRTESKYILSPINQSSPCITKPGSSLQIIHIDQVHTLRPELSPQPIPRANGPPRLIPVSHLDALPMRRRHLLPQNLKLRVVQPGAENSAAECSADA